VTYNLKNKNVQEATKYKQMLEQAQRDAAKQRLETGEKVKHKVGGLTWEAWVIYAPNRKMACKIYFTASIG